MSGKIEDAHARWATRNSAFHPDMLDVGEDLVKRLGELITAIGEFRDDVDEDVREYGSRRRS